MTMRRHFLSLLAIARSSMHCKATKQKVQLCERMSALAAVRSRQIDRQTDRIPTGPGKNMIHTRMIAMCPNLHHVVLSSSSSFLWSAACMLLSLGSIIYLFLSVSYCRSRAFFLPFSSVFLSSTLQPFNHLSLTPLPTSSCSQTMCEIVATICASMHAVSRDQIWSTGYWSTDTAHLERQVCVRS